MRRWWFVPFVLLLIVVFFRARPAGYTGTPTSRIDNTTTVTSSIRVNAPEAPTIGVDATPTVQEATPVVVGDATYADTAVTEAISPTVTLTPTIAPPTPTPEPPALAPAIAPPTAPPQPTAAPPNAQPEVPISAEVERVPVRLQIPEIGLDLKPVAVGIDDNRVPIVPKHDVGWYDASALPGTGSNVVFWGHVLRWLDSPQIAAPFARMKELKPGSSIEITLADGQRYAYRVTQQVQTRPEEVQYILPTDGERVTLVSCIGDNVIYEGVLTKEFRLITIAEPQ